MIQSHTRFRLSWDNSSTYPSFVSYTPPCARVFLLFPLLISITLAQTSPWQVAHQDGTYIIKNFRFGEPSAN